MPRPVSNSRPAHDTTINFASTVQQPHTHTHTHGSASSSRRPSPALWLHTTQLITKHDDTQIFSPQSQVRAVQTSHQRLPPRLLFYLSLLRTLLHSVPHSSLSPVSLNPFSTSPTLRHTGHIMSLKRSLTRPSLSPCALSLHAKPRPSLPPSSLALSHIQDLVNQIVLSGPLCCWTR